MLRHNAHSGTRANEGKSNKNSNKKSKSYRERITHMIPYKITPETISKANSYAPLAKKLEFVQYAAERCFTALNITASLNDMQTKTMPSMYKINTGLKSRYLMGAFLKLYLNEEYIPVEGDEWLLAQDDYDNYRSGHIFNEMNRLKSNNDIRDKVFDILSDFKELTAMLEEDLSESLTAMNDPVSRIYMTFTEMLAPEQVKQMLEDISAQKDEIEHFIAETKAEAAEAAETAGLQAEATEETETKEA